MRSLRPSRPAAWSGRIVPAALAQETLEVASDGLTGGQWTGLVVVILAGRLLEPLHERLHIRVALDREVDLALVVGCCGLELAGVDRDTNQPLELAHERERRLRVRRRRDVVRHGRPQARRGEPGIHAAGVEHADDPGGTFVA